MPPLDTGSVTHSLRLIDPLDERAEPAVADHPHVGAFLKAVREHRGRGVAEIAATTRISRSYLVALEEGNLAVLPSRPFLIGYVRAYAKALDLDEDAVAARFKAETPDTTGPLQPPIGVRHEKRERRPLVLALVAVVVVAVIGWNVAQRVLFMNDAADPEMPTVLTTPDAPVGGPISLGAPTPVPAEQTTPDPYVTPGLGVNPGLAAPASTSLLTPVMDRSAPTIFASRLPVHGVPAVGPTVVVFAKKPASLIVRGPTGAVHFARQLAAGESYRAPIGQRLVAEVTDPDAFALYINNQLQGSLATPLIPLDQAVSEAIANQPAAPLPQAAAPAAGVAAPRPAAAAPRPAAPRPSAARPAAPRPQAAAPAPAPAPITAAPAPVYVPPPPVNEPPLY
jgi:cytoskeleton protein RodZ